MFFKSRLQNRSYNKLVVQVITTVIQVHTVIQTGRHNLIFKVYCCYYAYIANKEWEILNEEFSQTNVVQKRLYKWHKITENANSFYTHKLYSSKDYMWLKGMQIKRRKLCKPNLKKVRSLYINKIFNLMTYGYFIDHYSNRNCRILLWKVLWR